MSVTEQASDDSDESSSSSLFYKKKPLLLRNSRNQPYHFSKVKQNSIFQIKVKNQPENDQLTNSNNLAQPQQLQLDQHLDLHQQQLWQQQLLQQQFQQPNQSPQRDLQQPSYVHHEQPQQQQPSQQLNLEKQQKQELIYDQQANQQQQQQWHQNKIRLQQDQQLTTTNQLSHQRGSQLIQEVKVNNISVAQDSQESKEFKNFNESIIKAAQSENSSMITESTDCADVSQQFLYKSIEKTIRKILEHVQTILEKLDIGYLQVVQGIQQECVRLLRNLSVKIHFIFKGRPYKSIAAGLVVLASRKFGLPLSYKKIVKASKMKARIINKSLNILKRYLPDSTGYKSSPINFLKLIAFKFGFNDENFNLAKSILNKLCNHSYRQSTYDQTLAGCSIFMTYLTKAKMDLKTTHNVLNQVAVVSEISRNSIQKVYHRFYSVKDEIFSGIVGLKELEKWPLL